MSADKRISKVYDNAKILPVGGESKIVLMSDCHRGLGGNNDDFAKNQNIVFTALNHYYRQGFSYIELGDGDELWQNRSRDYNAIVSEHANIFDLLSKFHGQNRLFMLFGNHDKVKKSRRFAVKYLYAYYDRRKDRVLPLFEGIQVHEGLLLRHTGTGGEMLLLHGHQADFFNDQLWWLSRFLVRYVWRPLELIGIRDPMSTSGNAGRKDAVERILSRWAERHGCPLIAGHTHRTMFPRPDEQPYWNDGCCVRLRFVTAIEIEDDGMRLVKWHVDTKPDGTLYVARSVIDETTPLAEIFGDRNVTIS